MRLSNDTTPAPTTNDHDPASLGSQLRIKDQLLAERETELEQMIVNLREMHPAFGACWDDIHRLKEEIPAAQAKLETLARNSKRTLDLAAYGYTVDYSNPMKEVVDAQALLSACPNIAMMAPDVVVVTQEVDIKAFKTALAAGALPAVCGSLLQKKPTTTNGRVVFKRLPPK